MCRARSRQHRRASCPGYDGTTRCCLRGGSSALPACDWRKALHSGKAAEFAGASPGVGTRWFRPDSGIPDINLEQLSERGDRVTSSNRQAGTRFMFAGICSSASAGGCSPGATANASAPAPSVFADSQDPIDRRPAKTVASRDSKSWTVHLRVMASIFLASGAEGYLCRGTV